SLADVSATGQRANSGATDRKLGEPLARLAADQLPPDSPLVLDTDALRTLGLTADTPLAAPVAAVFWEPLGLTAVPTAGAYLLTSRRQSADWQTGGLPVPGSAAAAVAEAAASGHDPSGRFRAVSDWLDLNPGVVSTDALPELVLHGPSPNWSAWESPPDLPTEPTVTVIRRGTA